MNNYAYIDGQNLYLGTKGLDENSWRIDLKKFRVYLREKYQVEKAFYYLGYVQEGIGIEHLYETIQSAGFILVFRQHNAAMIGKKKGNVDSDIIFSIMKRVCKDNDFDKIVLISGDGDYKMLIDFLIEEKRFEKILFPNRKFRSSLYKQIGAPFFAYLDDEDVKKKIQHNETKPRNKKRAP
ncbi:MAG: NYN domain-containing protein [Candidatus Microsaccharimonas sp.]